MEASKMVGSRFVDRKCTPREEAAHHGDELAGNCNNKRGARDSALGQSVELDQWNMEVSVLTSLSVTYIFAARVRRTFLSSDGRGGNKTRYGIVEDGDRHTARKVIILRAVFIMT